MNPDDEGYLPNRRRRLGGGTDPCDFAADPAPFQKGLGRALMALVALTGGNIPNIAGTAPIRNETLGTCQCGGRIYETSVSKKPRCNRCGKVGRFR